ncbi:DNA-binding transcriptional regulator, ArsR family [Amycolatopsis marina]|uniref:DNA-binding transcriptional regulator, ArsR family n=2 Tax=Amycolatopsis marina TaxID=490629 RepID=A0A1I0XV02_9PSEU|nr:DNA-binding transcriptional regulator, ArsR family [Amycolatopsis marina]
MAKLEASRTTRLPDLVWMLKRSNAVGEGADLVQDFFQVAIAPYWQRMQGLLDAERDARSRIVATGGVELLFSTLGPKARWRAPVLEIASELSGDVYLNGRGLLLAPSLFVADRGVVLIEPERESGRSVLVFAAPLDRAAGALLWGMPQANDQALAALVGRTRAAGLQALTDACTTGELANRLGISVAGASQHAAVLREAGLITTRRNRNAVLHTVTPLGSALLAGRLSSMAS